MANEVLLEDTDLLVSQTDEKGIVLYANDTFCEIAEYEVEELIGKPHSIVRHSDMPRVAFEDLWKTIKAGNTWEGFVKNSTKSGNYYWVFATVFPYKNGYMSIRKMATKKEINKYTKLYQKLKREKG